ncbi:hypothetical protein BX661DRAFT_197586 [Kickxella alabastrina]|uniref:uncharacterized protein n=1 Tax=Kickxella alabastrina TaxID=61397 RepID=UPI002220AA63|nr:uncharacterized protein BX661DRAFT_197586 [Kickxella alabastrina]KAI7831056.1 hypothetical protein BX661DRAFT_197586 [Kickxella alabastrina]
MELITLLLINTAVFYSSARSAAVRGIGTPTLHVFGDSLSDVGTLHQLTLGVFPPRPYWEGRFSSGPVWNEYLAKLLGYELYSKAIGGTVIELGSNDYFAELPNLTSGLLPVSSFVDTLISTLIGQLEQLRELGFKNIIVINLPAVQFTPMITQENFQNISATAVTHYNNKLFVKVNENSSSGNSSSNSDGNNNNNRQQQHIG